MLDEFSSNLMAEPAPAASSGISIAEPTAVEIYFTLMKIKRPMIYFSMAIILMSQKIIIPQKN